MKMIVLQFQLEFYQSILNTSDFNKKDKWVKLSFWIKILALQSSLDLGQKAIKNGKFPRKIILLPTQSYYWCEVTSAFKFDKSVWEVIILW